MSALWTARELVAATGGRIEGDWGAVTGVSIDTRTLKPGDLFVALAAARDGHDFVAQALEKGAAGALVTHRPEGVAKGARLLHVKDVLQALEKIGEAARARTGAKVVAVTGSVGKTSTKEMLRTVLEVEGRTHAAVASYNNHWGVPLTLARMPADTEFAVIEIGMSNPGEIAPLARMARPHVAMITTVAAAHLEAFESVAGIAREKAAIFEGLEPDGVAVINGDLPVSRLLAQAAYDRGSRIMRFGTGAWNHHRLMEINVADGATVARGRAWRTPFLLKISAPGRHFAMNAAGVLAVVRALGADRARALVALARWAPPGGRGQSQVIALDDADPDATFQLFDDAFNANPASMNAALEVLVASTPHDGIGRVLKGRRVAILGDMLELGPDEAALHAGIADHPDFDRIDVVHCVGSRMRHLYHTLPQNQRGHYVQTAPELAEKARFLADAGDVLLVKGSKGSKVSMVVDALKALGQSLPSNAHSEDV